VCRGRRGVRSVVTPKHCHRPYFPLRPRACVATPPHILPAAPRPLLDPTRVSLSLLPPSAIAPHSLSVSRKPDAGSSRSCTASVSRSSIHGEAVQGGGCVAAARRLLQFHYSWHLPLRCSARYVVYSCVCLSSVLLNISAAEE
jgi:hypothetical protein